MKFHQTTNLPFTIRPIYRTLSNIHSNQLRRPRIRNLHNVIDMVAHSDEEIEKQFPSFLHLHLHRPAALKRLATANDESQVMCAQPRVRVGRIVVCEARGPQDQVDGNSRLKTLFAERKTLQFLEPEFLGGAVDNCVAENWGVGERRELNCRLDGAAATGFGLCVFELPGVAPLVVQEAGVIVSLVEVF